MSAYNYVITAKAATAVHDAVKGNFMSPHEENLIISKGTYIEIYGLSGFHLESKYDFSLYGRIRSMEICNILGYPQGVLFVLTESHEYVMLYYDSKTKAINTYAKGVIQHKFVRKTKFGPMTSINQNGKIIITSIFGGVISVISLTEASMPVSSSVKGKSKDTGKSHIPVFFNVRIPENEIISITTVWSMNIPKFAILYADENERRHLKTYDINMATKSLVTKNQFHTSVEDREHIIVSVPEPYKGVLVIGELTVSYYDLEGSSRVLSVNAMDVKGCGLIKTNDPGVQYLIGDCSGMLHMITLRSMARGTPELLMETIGQTHVPSSIVDLGNGIIYLGSPEGDSCLIKLSGSLDNRVTFEVIEEYPSLAPITDFCLFDLDNQGMKTMVCCSGVANDGSLRMVRGGIRFSKHFGIPMDGITKIWSLSSKNDLREDVLVISLLHSTRLVQYDYRTMSMGEVADFSNFCYDEPTVATAITSQGNIIQVTPSCVWLMPYSYSCKQSSRWSPPEPGAQIYVAYTTTNTCVISYGKGNLVSLNTRDFTLSVKKQRTFDNEISCIYVSPEVKNNSGKRYVAIGLWGGQDVKLLNLSDLSTVWENKIEAGTVPKDVRYTRLGEYDYFLVGLGDGRLVYFCSKDGMKSQREISIGIGKLSFHSFEINGESAIFVSSDRPTIITSSHGKLVYSSVNAEEIFGFCTFNCPNKEKYSLLATSTELVFGWIDNKRSLHSIKFPLDQRMGRKLAYHEESKTIAIGTVQTKAENDVSFNKGWLQIFDAYTLKCVDTIDLLENELIESLLTTKIEGYPTSFLFVGTAILGEDDSDPDNGRILIYKVCDRHTYSLIDVVEVPGVVYDIQSIKGSIVASVVGTIYYMSHFNPDADKGERFTVVPKLDVSNTILSIDTSDDKILTGDLMHSMALLKMEDSESPQLEKVARDFNSSWMTTVKILRDDVYIGADALLNLFTLRPTKQTDDVPSERLEVIGEYQLGDLVNKFRNGTLSEERREKQDVVVDRNTFLYATVNGAIGTISSISLEEYDVLLKIQQQLETLPSIGSLEHRKWRSFNNGTRTGEPRGFIDGDLIEGFLHLSTQEKKRIHESTAGLYTSLSDIIQLIESLSDVR
ncbi:CPSF A subunit region-domain-containing protein [Phycomyces nitens]|nr:CPSF A subunit region-domain-containing protein [Phycomyces nitens]